MSGSQNKYKKYEKVNTRFPADPWKMTFSERNDLFLSQTGKCVGQCVHPKVFQSIGCKTAFCTELNLLTPFSSGKNYCLIVEIILHFA